MPTGRLLALSFPVFLIACSRPGIGSADEGEGEATDTSAVGSADTNDDEYGEEDDSNDDAPILSDATSGSGNNETSFPDTPWCMNLRPTGVPHITHRMEAGDGPPVLAYRDSGSGGNWNYRFYVPVGDTWSEGDTLITGQFVYFDDLDGEGWDDLGLSGDPEPIVHAAAGLGQFEIGAHIIDIPWWQGSVWHDVDDDGYPDSINGEGCDINIRKGYDWGKVSDLISTHQMCNFIPPIPVAVTAQQVWVIAGGSFGAASIAIGARNAVGGFDWYDIFDINDSGPMPMGLVDFDNNGVQELLLLDSTGTLHRIWVEEDAPQHEILAENLVNPVVGQTPDGEWWMLSTLSKDTALQLIVEGELEDPDHWFDTFDMRPQVARDFGATNTEVVVDMPGGAALLSMYSCP